MEPQNALLVAVAALAGIDLVLIVVCARMDARVEELRKALAASTGQHQGPVPPLETTVNAAGPDAQKREKKLPPKPFSLASQAAVRSKAEALRRARHERERFAAQQGGTA